MPTLNKTKGLYLKLLAIDTSTDACSAALWLDGDVRQRYQVAPREHGQLILPMIEALLAEAGLDVDGIRAAIIARWPQVIASENTRIAAG